MLGRASLDVAIMPLSDHQTDVPKVGSEGAAYHFRHNMFTQKRIEVFMNSIIFTVVGLPHRLYLNSCVVYSNLTRLVAHACTSSEATSVIFDFILSDPHWQQHIPT